MLFSHKPFTRLSGKLTVPKKPTKSQTTRMCRCVTQTLSPTSPPSPRATLSRPSSLPIFLRPPIPPPHLPSYLLHVPPPPPCYLIHSTPPFPPSHPPHDPHSLTLLHSPSPPLPKTWTAVADRDLPREGRGRGLFLLVRCGYFFRFEV